MAIAPILLGALSDAIGFHLAFLLVPVFLGGACPPKGLVELHPLDDLSLYPAHDGIRLDGAADSGCATTGRARS